MNIKKGTLVMIKAGAPNPECAPFVGTVRQVGERDHGYEKSWYLLPATMACGQEISWHERRLLPLNPGEGEDQTLQWAPVPQKEPA